MKKVLELKNLSKYFSSDVGMSSFIACFKNKEVNYHATNYVIRNLSFSLHEGELISIIGKNGAGKSTILKIISGVTPESGGELTTFGSISSILELGVGFHPELSGKDNVKNLLTLILKDDKEITEKINQIEIFADIGDHFLSPYKFYSTGMQVRLAFSMITAYRPNILLIDEALSVGDKAFQAKCINRIKSFIKAGTGVLFVSHDIEVVKKLSDKVILIDNGELQFFGDPVEACLLYEKN